MVGNVFMVEMMKHILECVYQSECTLAWKSYLTDSLGVPGHSVVFVHAFVQFTAGVWMLALFIQAHALAIRRKAACGLNDAAVV